MTETSHSEKSDNQVDIFLAGQRYLDDRDRAVRRGNGRLKALVGALVIIIAILATENMRTASKSHLVPYVIQIDPSGRIVNTEILKQRAVGDVSVITPLMIQMALEQWVEYWRTCTTDDRAQRNIAVNKVLTMVADGSAAHRFIMAAYQANNPVKRATEKGTVEAHWNNIVPLSDNTYELYWQEAEMPNGGGAAIVTRWRCVITFTVVLPRNNIEVNKNPSGIFITYVTEPKGDAL